jgi:hypothetical protein
VLKQLVDIGLVRLVNIIGVAMNISEVKMWRDKVKHNLVIHIMDNMVMEPITLIIVMVVGTMGCCSYL